jgi:hypothetical protein
MVNQPGLSGASLHQENYIQPNLGHGLRIWWAYYWPTFLISSVIIGVLTVVLRKAWENVMISGQVVLWADRILPYVVIAVVSVLGIRRILGKKFRSFYVALLPSEAAFGGEPLSPSFQRTLRVWWAFIWRSVIFSVIFRFAGSVAIGLTIGMFASMEGPMGASVPFVAQVLMDGAVGLFVIYSGILDEEFGDFRVTLVPRETVVSATPAVEPAAPDPAS